MPKFNRPPLCGWARYVYPNGDEYWGQFQQGLRHGHGLYLGCNGVTYAGRWWEDQRHGEGTLLHERSGFMYYGMWVGDKKQGVGQLLSNGECYWGAFGENRFNGRVCSKYNIKI